MIEELAARLCYPRGKRRGKPVGARTIRNWIKAYEAEGIAGLMRKARGDARKRRVIISRQWDALAGRLGIGEAEQARILDELRRHIASLWRSGVPSWPTAQMNALPFLMEQTGLAAGRQLADAEREACQPPRKLVEASRHYRAVAIRRKDAGRSAAIQTPRIRRHRGHLKPMEWVAGDVHHIDIAFRREDGSLCTIKAVAWMDLATNRAFITIHLMPKGQMIRREHVIESFVEMCSDPNWGVPTNLYVDNGGEYNWGEVIADVCKIKGLTVRDAGDLAAGEGELNGPAGMRKSRPYTPQSKVIETLFGSLERVAFSQLPGHIGGDRMKKKTENQGKEPQAYPGTLADFKKSLAGAIEYYHRKPQAGFLAGKSPFDRFGELIAKGWTSTILGPDELSIVFSREEIRHVRAGGTFSLDGQTFRHDSLMALAGIGTVLVRVPLFGDKSRLFVFDDEGTPLCVAIPEEEYAFDDIAGAGEQQRRATIFNQQIRSLETESEPLDLSQVMAEAVAVHGPAPQAAIGGTVTVNSGFREMAELARQAPPTKAVSQQETERRRKSAILARLAADRGAA